jgi:hypothetical protein
MIRTRHLMTSTIALALGIGMSVGMSQVAFATCNADNSGHCDETISGVGAVAASIQAAEAERSFAIGTLGDNTISGDVSGQGLLNIQQNTGANSVLQGHNTLGMILSNSKGPQNGPVAGSIGEAGALALSSQFASSEHNISIGAADISHSGHDNRKESKNGATGDWSETHNEGWNSTFTNLASSNTINNVSAIGMVNVQQNAGNNSVLQAGNTTAAIINNTAN